jgi:hypothetical protein
MALLPEATARADDAAPEPPGRFRVGAFYLTPRLEIRNAGYDSNVYNSGTAPVSDATFVVAPVVEAALPAARRLTLRARGLLTFNWYDQQGGERSTDRDLGLSALLRFGRVKLAGERGWGRSKQRFSLDLDERLPHDVARSGLRATVQLARRLELSASLENDRFDIEGPAEVEASLDHDSRNLGVDAAYDLTRRTALLLRAERIRDRFDQSFGGATRQARSRRYMGGFRFGVKAVVTGQLLAGVREFRDEAGSAAPPYTGPALDVSLGVPAGPLGRLNLRVEREVQYSATPGSEAGVAVRNSYVFSRRQVELQSALPLDLIGRGFLQWQGGSYRVPYVVDGVALGRDATLRVFGFSVLKPLGESLRIGGGCSWERRRSTLPGDDYRGTRYGMQAEYVP